MLLIGWNQLICFSKITISGSTPSQGKKETGLADTELHQKDRRRAMEFDRPINEELGAALGGVEDNNSVRDDGTPELHPEQQIRDAEEMLTLPRRQPRGVGSQQPRGPRVGVDESTSGLGYMAVPPMRTMGRDRLYSEWSPVETLEGTVSRMQRDLDNLQSENRFLRTRRATGPVPLVRQAALTTTKVPWFSGSTSWEQYQQVFDAIVLSNGWDDATAALQLLSHLQGDALSVALLIPMPRRASRKELTDALSSHYGSPGRLASYRRQFDKTERKPGEDPANFGITLETLAVKAFGDIGQTSRLQLIRDRFIAGHESCELRRHLDCLPPDTPLWDIVDRCREWESHSDFPGRSTSRPEPPYPAYVVATPEKEPDPVRAVTVNKPECPVEDTNELLRKLVEMLTPKATPTPRVPELAGLDKLAQLLTEKVAIRKPTLPMQTEPIKFETRLQDFIEGRQRADQEFRQRPVQRDWAEMKCFSCGKSGHSATRCPTLDITFPFILPGWKAEKSLSGYMMVSPRRAMERQRTENVNCSGGGGGGIPRISNVTRPHDPGGGGGGI